MKSDPTGFSNEMLLFNLIQLQLLEASTVNDDLKANEIALVLSDLGKKNTDLGQRNSKDLK